MTPVLLRWKMKINRLSRVPYYSFLFRRTGNFFVANPWEIRFGILYILFMSDCGWGGGRSAGRETAPSEGKLKISNSVSNRKRGKFPIKRSPSSSSCISPLLRQSPMIHSSLKILLGGTYHKEGKKKILGMKIDILICLQVVY